MAKVTNESKNPVVLVDGTFIAIGGTEEVKDWAAIKKHHVSAAMLEAGSLKADSGKEESSEREDLFAQLKALGIDAAGNSKTETLQKKLDEALAAKELADVTAQLKEKGVEFDEKDSLDDLKAKLAAAK